MGRFRCTVSVEETAFTPYHDREIPKHSFRRGDLIHPLSYQRDSEAQFPWRRPYSPPIMSERFRSTVSVEETSFTPYHDRDDFNHPYHVREIPKHSFRRGDLIHPLSCQRDSEAHFPLETSFTPYNIREIPKHTFRRKPHSPPIISDRFRSTVSFEETTFIPIISEGFLSTVSFEETTITPYHIREIPYHSFSIARYDTKAPNVTAVYQYGILELN